MTVYLYQNNRLTSALEYSQDYKEDNDMLFLLDTASIKSENLQTKIKYIYNNLNQITDVIQIKENGSESKESGSPFGNSDSGANEGIGGMGSFNRRRRLASSGVCQAGRRTYRHQYHGRSERQRHNGGHRERHEYR
jgi:hypothetical protein